MDPAASCACRVLLVSIDNTIVNVALPTISRDLAASTSQLQWVVDAYTLVFAGLLLLGGHLGDRFGRRRMLQVRHRRCSRSPRWSPSLRPDHRAADRRPGA